MRVRTISNSSGLEYERDTTKMGSAVFDKSPGLANELVGLTDISECGKLVLAKRVSTAVVPK